MATKRARASSRLAPPRADHSVEYLRAAGDHPLMRFFPQGAVFSFDHDLRYLSAGGLGLADVGLSRELLEGRTIAEVFPAETVAAIEPYYRAAIAGESTVCDIPYEGRIYTQRLAPVSDPDGRIVAGLGFTHDVTQMRRAEQALQQSEQRNRLTFEAAPIGQALVGLDGTWLQVNAAVAALTGYSERQLLAMTFQDITHPDDLDLDLGNLAQLVAGEIGSYQIEKRYLTATGRVVWVLLSVALVRDEADRPLYFISQIVDITERRQQHQALQDLTAMLAHDLRTPATVITGFAELLEISPRLDPEDRGYLARISAAARAMSDLLDNALTTTTLDAGTLVATPRAVSVRDALRTVLATTDLDALDIDTGGVADLTVLVDPIQFRQILANLLTNARKYGGHAVRIAAHASGRDVCLSIADDGPGVDPGFVPHLFDRYSRSASARNGQQRGSGLGLSIVRDLLAANGATIGYEPESGGGARFVIQLPLAPSLDHEHGHEHEHGEVCDDA